MNYLQEIVAFNEWKEVNQLPATAIALWYELMAICNKCGWRREFTVPNGLLQIRAGLSRKQFDLARQLLIQKGRIEYRKSKNANEAGRYILIPIVQKGQQEGQQKGQQQGKQEGQQEEHRRGTLNKLKLKRKLKYKKRDSSPPQVENSKTPYQEIVDLYNATCLSLPKVKDLTEKRKGAMRLRWRKWSGLDYYHGLFQKAEASDFISGRSGKWTGCNFDWLLNESNMVKVLEGSYDNKAPSPTVQNSQSQDKDKYWELYLESQKQRGCG